MQVALKKIYAIAALIVAIGITGNAGAQDYPAIDSISAAGTDSTLVAADSVDIFAIPQLTKKEMKRAIRDFMC